MTLVLGILCLVAGLSSFFSMSTAPEVDGNNVKVSDDGCWVCFVL